MRSLTVNRPALIMGIFFSAKIVVSRWGIFVFFILSFYLSNLRAFIVAPEFEKPVTSLQDVIERLVKVVMFILFTQIIVCRFVESGIKQVQHDCSLALKIFLLAHSS